MSSSSQLDRSAPRSLFGGSPDAPARFLSKTECTALAKRAAALGHGGGETRINIDSEWRGNIRWARNEVTTAGDTRDTRVSVTRSIRGADGFAVGNAIGDVDLEATVRRAERLVSLRDESGDSAMRKAYDATFLQPDIWSDATYGLDPRERVEAMRPLAGAIAEAGMLSAGYIEVSAHGVAHIESDGSSMYYPYTSAQYSVTVRDPDGTGSGWAGIDWADWTKVDAIQLTRTALTKCLTSRNPVAVEPGRYTAILEPQAVCDLVSPLFGGPLWDRQFAEGGNGPFAGPKRGLSKIGAKIMDSRITITADPLDPLLGFVPFNVQSGEVYAPAAWVENGILKNLAYGREYGIKLLGKDSGLPDSGSLHMLGGTTTQDEMIATTKRGILVTRFSDVALEEDRSVVYSGFTRDGLWLIENGKISKPIKNFRFVESALFAFNNLVQLGVAQRVFHPAAPVVVPAVKVNDFNFTSLADAV